HIVEADRLVRDEPARERRRLMRQHLREIAHPAPLLDHRVIDLAGLDIGVLRLDHLDARHGGLLLACRAENVARSIVYSQRRPRTPGSLMVRLTTSRCQMNNTSTEPTIAPIRP